MTYFTTDIRHDKLNNFKWINMIFNNTDDMHFSINEDGLLILTQFGLNYLRHLFARSGINIHNIDTYEKFQSAWDQSTDQLINHIYQKNKAKDSLEAKILISILDGDQEKYEAYIKQLKRRNNSNLKLVK